MNREEKKALVNELHTAFAETGIVVVTHYSGLTVSQATELRGKVREAGAAFKVTKNRLTKRALEGTAYEQLADKFTGPTAIAYSEDPVAAAKAVVEFAKDNEQLTIVGGALGEKALEARDVEALAKLPSLDELRAKIVGMLNTPATRIAGVLQAPGGQIARVCGAYGAKEG